MNAPAVGAAPLRRRRVAVTLAAADARRLARHPFVLAGAALGVVMVAGTGARVNGAFEVLLGYGLMPLAIGTCLAAQLLTSRSRRNATTELEAAVAADAEVRTFGALAALTGPLVVAVVYLVIALVWVQAWNGVPVALADGIRDITMHPVELAQGLVGVAFFGALGAALGAWVPSRFVPPVLLAALLFVFTVLGWSAQGWVRWALPLTHHETVSLQWVQVTPRYGYGVVAGYDRVALAWHVAYVGALTALMAVVALLRHRRDRSAFAAAGLLAALTVVLSVVQVP